MSSQDVILEIVNAFSIRSIPFSSFDELQSLDVISSLLKLIKKQDIAATLEEVATNVDSLFTENFSADNLISVKKAVDGDNAESYILYLLLIYICLLSDNDLRKNIIQASLNLSTEIKLKHLIECIQNRMSVPGRGQTMFRQYLDILIAEDLDFLVESVGTPKTKSAPSNVYSSTPELKRNLSPLRDFLQSPSFRIQRQLRERDKQIRSLMMQVNSLEDDVREITDNKQIMEKKYHSLECDKQKVIIENMKFKQNLDEMLTKTELDEKRTTTKMEQQHKAFKDLENEKTSILSDSDKILQENEELDRKLKNSYKENRLLNDENKKLEELAGDLKQTCTSYEKMVSQLKENEKILEDYKLHYQEYMNSKAMNRTIEESFEGRSSLTTDLSSRWSKASMDASTFSTEGENMADAVIDKILEERNIEVEELKKEKQRLLTQVNESENAQAELKRNIEFEVGTINSQLQVCKGQVTELQHENMLLTGKVNSLESGNSELMSQCGELSNERNAFQADVAQLCQHRDMNQNTINGLVKEVESLNEKISISDMDSINKDGKIAQMVGETASLSQQLAAMTENRSQIENRCMQLSQECDLLTNKVQFTEKRQSDIAAECNGLNMEKETLLATIEDLNNYRSRSLEERSDFSVKFNIFTDKIGSLETANAEYISQHRELTNLNSALKVEVAQLCENRSRNQNTINDMERQMELLNEQISVAQLEGMNNDGKIANMNAESASLAQQLATMTQGRNDKESCLNKLSLERDQLISKVQLTEKRESDLAAQCNELKTAKNELLTKIECLHSDIKSSSEETFCLNAEKQQLKEKVKYMGEEMNHKEERLTVLHCERDSLVKELGTTKESLHEEKFKYDSFRKEYDVVLQKAISLETKNAEILSQCEKLEGVRSNLETVVQKSSNDNDLSQNKVNALQTEIASLNQKVAHADIQIRDKDIKIGEHEVECNLLTQQVVALTDSQNNMAKNLNKRNKQCDVLSDQVKLAEELKAERVIECEGLKSLRDNLQEQLETINKQLTDTSENMNCLKTENELLSQKIDNLSKETVVKDEQIEELTSRKSSLSLQLEFATETSTNISKSLSTLTEERDVLVITNKHLSEENVKFRESNATVLKENENKQEEIKALQGKYDNKETEMKETYEQHYIASNKVVSLQESLADSKEKCDNLVKEKFKLTTDVEKMKKDAVNYENEILTTEGELQKSTKLVCTLENRASECISKFEKTLAANSHLKEQINELEAWKTVDRKNITSLENEVQKLTEKIGTTENQSFEHQRKYENGLEENRNFLQQIIQLKDEKDELRGEVNSLKDGNHEMSNEKSNLERELARISQENNSMQRKSDDLKIQIEKSENAFRGETQTIINLQSEVNNLKCKLSSNKQKMQAEAESIDKQKEELLIMENAVNVARDHQKTIDSLKEELTSLQDQILSERKCNEEAVVNKQKEEMLAKKNALKLEREHQKTVDRLKKEVTSSQEQMLSVRSNHDKMKSSYKVQMEKIMKEITEFEQEREETHNVWSLKYEKSKTACLQLSTELKNSKSQNIALENEVSKLQHQTACKSADESKLTQLQQDRDLIKSTLIETEAKLKRVITEDNSLKVQLKSAETVIQSLKRDSSRFSITSGMDTEWDNSQTLLLPKTKTRSKSNNKQTDMAAPPPPRLRSQPIAKCSSSTLKEPMVAPGQVSCKPTTRSSSSVVAPPAVKDDGKIKNSIPRNMMNYFRCEDECDDGDFGNDAHLANLKNNKLGADSPLNWSRLSELQRRNSLYPPHMRSAYVAELQCKSIPGFTEEQFRQGQLVNDQFLNLADATERLNLDSPHSYNLRKRKSVDGCSISTDSSPCEKKAKRLTPSYSRPGPPTPAKQTRSRQQDINLSQLSIESTTSRESKVSAYSLRTPKMAATPKAAASRAVTVKSPTFLALRSGQGASPISRKGRTPNSLLRIMKRGKSPWRKLSETESPAKATKSRRLITTIKEAIKH